jgi:hypothetical protein
VDYFTADGTWEYFEGDFGSGCNIGEYLDKKEGIILTIQVDNDKTISNKWKIVKLTNKELKLYKIYAFRTHATKRQIAY